jgi:hypothetical protein
MFTTNDPRSTAMRTYKFALLPSNASVAAGVTLLVAAWFAVAAGVIIMESPAERSMRAAQHKPAAVAVSASLPTTTSKPAMKRA